MPWAMILCQIILCEGGNDEFRFLVSALSKLVRTFLAKTQFQNFTSFKLVPLYQFCQKCTVLKFSQPGHICNYMGRYDYLSIDET